MNKVETTALDFAKALRHIELIGEGKLVGSCAEVAREALNKHPGWVKR